MDITTVLLTIQSLLDKNPLHHEPGQEKNVSMGNQLYNNVIEYDSINTLLLKNFLDPPPGFDIFLDDMKNEFKKNNQEIQKFLSKMKEEKRKEISVSFYRIQTVVDYPELIQKYEQLSQQFLK